VRNLLKARGIGSDLGRPIAPWGTLFQLMEDVDGCRVLDWRAPRT
jgi:hypothetical protein